MADHTIALASQTSLIVDGTTAAPISQQSHSGTIFTAGSDVFTATSAAEGYYVGYQNIQPGSTITLSGHTIAIQSQTGLIIDGTPAASFIQNTDAGIFTAGSDLVSYSALPSSSGIVISGHTLLPGSTITAADHTIAYPSPSGLVVDDSTIALPSSKAGAGVLAAGSGPISYSALSSSPGIVISGQTLFPGSTLTAAGHTFALPTGSAIVVDGTTSTPSAQETPYSILTAGSSSPLGTFYAGSDLITYSVLPSSSGILVAGQTLLLGSTITASGHTIALPSVSAIIADGTTLTMAARTTPGSVFTAGGNLLTFSMLPQASGIAIAGQTLRPGSAVTVKGESLSLPPGGSAIVIDGTTTALVMQESQANVLTVGNTLFSYSVLPQSSSIAIAGQTLKPGSAVTVNGETLSLPSGGSSVIAVSGATATTEGIGGAIMSGIGGPTSVQTYSPITGSSTPKAFTGAANRHLHNTAHLAVSLGASLLSLALL